MNIGKIDRQVLKMFNIAKVIRKVEVSPRDKKYMQNACYRFSEITGKPISEIQKLTNNASLDQFTFLKTLVNKCNHQKSNSIEDRTEHLFNVYSMVDKPSVQHLNIVRKTNDSFESLEKIFSLAKDEETLRFVENLQYGELKNSQNASKIIIDILNSKNRDKYIFEPEKYSSFLELQADNKDAIKILDSLVESGKFSKLSFDSKLAVKKLFKKQKVGLAMSGKANELEKMYSKERAGFLSSVINNFIPLKKTPEAKTKAVIVNMYETFDKSNAELRQSIIKRFKNSSAKSGTAEIIEMQALFNKIDNDKDAKTFVKKAINKDLRIASIAELNEVLNSVPLKKANIFFNNAKNIIENSYGEERKIALTVELENPFFKSKTPKDKNARIVRMFNNQQNKENFFTRTYKIIENKINQIRYNHMAA